MSWTSPATVTTGQLMTAAFWNQQVRDNFSFLTTIDGAGSADSRTFTNTGFLDLDALTGGAGTIAAVSVSIATGDTALVTVSAATIQGSGGNAYLSYKVSGASTIAADVSARTLRALSIGLGASRTDLLTGLTPGTNVFELQAMVTGGTGTLTVPELIVQPIPG